MEENHRRFKEKNKTTNSNKFFILLTVIFVLCFVITLILLIYQHNEYSLNLKTKKTSKENNFEDIEKDFQKNWSENTTISASSDNKILYVIIDDVVDTAETTKTIKDILEEYKNSYLQGYDKVMIYTYIKGEDNLDNMFIIYNYNLTTSTLDETTGYITLKEYTEMYNNYYSLYETYNDLYDKYIALLGY